MNVQNSIALGVTVGVGIATKVAYDYFASLSVFEKVKIVASLAILGYGTYLATSAQKKEQLPILKAETPSSTPNPASSVSQTTSNKKTRADYKSLEKLIWDANLWDINGYKLVPTRGHEIVLEEDRISNAGHVYRKGWTIHLDTNRSRGEKVFAYTLPGETTGASMIRSYDKMMASKRGETFDNPLKHIDDLP